MKRMFFVILLTLICSVASNVELIAQEERSPLTIMSDGKRYQFQVEVVATLEDRGRGLMFREQMALAHGMLFDFGEERLITMWMANTILPLDMVFIDEAGCVLGVAANTTPHSREPIPSPGPARYVLEINAGVARMHQIDTGDRIQHEIVETADACD